MTEKNNKNKLLVPIIGIISLLIIFIYPKIIIAQLGAANPWTSYLYQYGLGLVIFTIGLILIRKTGSCQPGRGRDGIWYKWLFAGFLIFAITHAIWIHLSLSMPVKGGL